MYVCIFVCIKFRFCLGHYVNTHGLLLCFLSKYTMYCTVMNCTFRAYSILVWIWFDLFPYYYHKYFIVMTLSVLYIVYTWQVLYPPWWISGILNEWMNELAWISCLMCSFSCLSMWGWWRSMKYVWWLEAEFVREFLFCSLITSRWGKLIGGSKNATKNGYNT